MTRTELIVRTRDTLPEMTLEQVTACCGALLDNLASALAAGRDVTLPGLGEFRIKRRKGREGYDARCGLERTIPACAVVQFYPHQSLKDRLNKTAEQAFQS